MDEEKLELAYVPALILLLVHAQNKKGTPLTREEVEDIRDNGTCIVCPVSVNQAMDEKRGYSDINPDYAWEEWQEYLKQTQDE
ncbi:hypothetical protein [Xenorhabdus sp. PB30.3]|uniref:hypothetical protein n=1 Tax=Xenorhabdus sp. PB30.3 TaxID=2788941 RepID=UPI001E2FF3DA|nr:hypothetical protein [Xenorhabdus sp. PB30.3]MCC8379533.1 hypothetical protein [Xenorhabdus sp. PB30.3]